ncbi:MAG: iron-sulfur cluster repair di-iron protein [Ferruginibacter sp.]
MKTIVTENHACTTVLKKYQLDYCCGGKTTLLQACNNADINLNEVMQALENVIENHSSDTKPFKEMDQNELISYVLIHYHFYTKQAIPRINEYLEKIEQKHGKNFSYLKPIKEKFNELGIELMAHMIKEEMILFPRISNNFSQKISINKNESINKMAIVNPISTMEMEHEYAGNIIKEIHTLSNNYTIPEDACNTFRICFQELEKFEQMLFDHIHIENNLIFPEALKH